jgi:outer membrane protein assembly factor BamA
MAVFKEIPGFILSGTVIGVHGRLNRYFNVSETPFPMLPSLGGANDLRGFSNFRFRGPWSLLCNLEIRQPIFSLPGKNTTKEGNPSSMVILAFFADAGQVADEFSGFCWDRFHSDVGFGLRIYLGEAVLRADMAFSDEGNGFHMCFNELF